MDTRALSIILHALLLAGLAVVAGCSSPQLPGRSAGAEVVPGRWEPPSAAGNRSPYRVLGQTYHVLPSAAGFEQTGIASWYGRKFHGRQTSNGERYDMYAISAAHKTLPLPTWVRVTNLDNGRTLDVRVNDRGPFHEDRILDLSYAAARKLGFERQGTARVHIVALTPSTAPEFTPTPEAPRNGAFFLQAGAFEDIDSALRMRSELEQVLDADAPVGIVQDADLHRVRVGPFDRAAAAERYQFLLMAADFGVPLMVEEAL